MKDLTIVVPLYNKVNYISDCLESILKTETSYDYECIVIDDYSNDGSSQIAEEFCLNHQDRFTYIRCLRVHDRYPSYARNLGIRLADSKYIMFFDSDDILCHDYVERGITWMNEHEDTSLYFENFYIVYSERDDGSYDYYDFAIEPMSCDEDYNWMIDNGGGILIRGIMRTEEVKKHRYKDVMLEDSVFLLDFLYPMKKYHHNPDNYSFIYFSSRSEQDAIVLSRLNNEGLTDREYLKDYVKNTYNNYYNTYYKTK